MDDSLRDLVFRRAKGCCEYCQMPQQFDPIPFEVDHIIARKHHGLSVESNLALTCFNCNSFKGPNISGIDPETMEITRLFHPRQDVWYEHFDWQEGSLMSDSAIGRVTIDVLKINLPYRVAFRQELIEEGVFPPAV